MAKQSSVNLDITNNPDGFDISGGTTLRKLSVTGGDVTIAGSGSATVTFPTTSTTIAGLGIAQTFSALQSFSVGISAAGATFSGNISAPNIVNSLNGFTGAVQVTGSGAILQTVSGTTTTFEARLSTATVTGVASFDSVFFSVGTSGHIRLAAAYQATGSGIATVPLATTSLTGTASFNPNRFQVSATGNVDLLAAFQVTGQTVVSGGPSQLVSTSGNTVTIDNRIATSSVTGVASFNVTRFSVSAAGAVDLGAAFQATGDTVLAGSAINFSTSGTTKTINNIGVTSFNGATGAVTFTVPLATTSLTGTASFNPNRFQVSATGNVDLLAAFQVTGQTVVSGGASQLVSTSGNTVTIDNRVATASLTGVASFSGTFFTVSATGSVQLSAAYQATGSGIATVPLATTSLTGTASFNPNRFQVSATGNVDLLAAYQATGDTVITVAGSGIGISTSGKTDTLFNIGVTAFNGLTGNVSLTGDGGAVQGKSNNTITTRLASISVTGVASFNNVHFTVDTTGHVKLATAYQVTGDTIQAGSFINIGAGKTINNIGVQTLNGATGAVTNVAKTNVDNNFSVAQTIDGPGTYLEINRESVGSFILTPGVGIEVNDAVNFPQTLKFNQTNTTTTVTLPSYTTTLAGLSGNQTFTGLNSFNAGLSASGATFSGDIAVQGGDITTSSATATVFNTTATTLSIGNAATSWTMGATSGTARIRNPIFTLGNTTSTITTNALDGNNLTIAPYGSVNLSPSSQSVGDGTLTTLIVNATQDGAGQVQIGGGDLYLGNKNDGFANLPVNIIFEGSTDNANDTTLTVVNPTATRTITLPDASGTVALTNTTVASINGFTGAVQVTGSGAVVHSVSGTTTTLGARLASISVTGVASFNNVHFTVDTTGHVKLATAYQVTGQTIVAGNNISTTTSGNTVTINVTAGGANNSFQFNDNGRLTGSSDFTYDPSTGETIITSGGSARSISLFPGAEAYIQSNGNSNLNLMGGNSGVGTVRIGDIDYNGDGTRIIIDDGVRSITLNAGDNIYATSNLTTLSGNLIAVGATFSGNISVGGNATLGNAATDTTTIYGTKIVNEGIYANGSLRTANISFANGQVQTLTGVGTGATGMTAIYFTGAPSTGAASITAIITNGGLMTGAGMTSWGGNIKWPGATKPVLTSSGVDVVSFVTPDAGTTIYGFVGGLGFS
jgi:hypothetical protein